MESYKNTLLDLEKKLLQPEIRKSVNKISEILSEDFIEFCSSGHVYIYDKNDVIDDLKSTYDMRGEIIDFQIKMLSDECILATYKLIKHGEDDINKKYSVRSSIWKNINGRWMMIFHQGTLVVK